MTTRIPVTLKEDDEALMLQLRSKLEGRLRKRLTVAEIVRISLRTQAREEGINLPNELPLI